MRPMNTLATLAFTLALSVTVGCGDDDKPTAPAGNNNNNSGTAITSANVATVGAQVGVLLASVGSTPGTHAGAGGGTVTVALQLGKSTAAAQNLNLSYTFDGYSSDGASFVDGTVSYAINTATTSLSYQGDLTFSGTYTGTIGIDIQVSGGVASGTYTVNGQSVSI